MTKISVFETRLYNYCERKRESSGSIEFLIASQGFIANPLSLAVSGEMAYSRRSRFYLSPSPYRRYSRSISRSPSRSRSRDSRDAENPGNNLYVTGLSTRVSRRDLEKHFSTEGKVEDVRLVVDPWTQESRGFGFVTMSTVEDADRCVKYLDRSVLQSRVITVEKARRRKGRTPTPGRYLGLRTVCARRGSPTYPRSVSPCYSSERERGSSRSYSPCYNRRRQYYSPSNRRRSYSPSHRRGRSYSRSRSPSYSRSPVKRQDRAYSPTYHRCYSPDERYYRRRSCSPYHRRGRSYSRSRSPSYSRSPVRRRDRSYSPTYHRYYSPYERYYRRHYRSSQDTPDGYKYRRSRSLSRSRSISPVHGRCERRYSRNISPRRSVSPKYYRRSYCRSVSHGDSRSSRRHSRSPSADLTSPSG